LWERRLRLRQQLVLSEPWSSWAPFKHGRNQLLASLVVLRVSGQPQAILYKTMKKH
jgi:hypothetical protein